MGGRSAPAPTPVAAPPTPVPDKAATLPGTTDQTTAAQQQAAAGDQSKQASGTLGSTINPAATAARPKLDPASAVPPPSGGLASSAVLTG